MQISFKPSIDSGDPLSDWANVRSQMLNAIRAIATEIKSDFAETTATWENHHPSWETHPSLAKGMISVSIAPKDNFAGVIWNWIDKGTPAHTISAGIFTGRSDKRTLAFTGPFRPKTRRGFIGTFTGSKGTEWSTPERVNNPGIEAREFSKEIAERNAAWFQEKMQTALNEFAKNSKLAKLKK